MSAELSYGEVAFQPDLSAAGFVGMVPDLLFDAVSFVPDLRLAAVAMEWIMYSDAEVPQGEVDGVNRAFTVENAPNPPASLQLFQGLIQWQGDDPEEDDYVLEGNLITFYEAPTEPLIAWYRFRS